MATPERTYRLLSDGVEAMRVGHKLAAKRADAHAKGTLSERAAGRSEYILALQKLQEDAQGVLDGTSEQDRKEMLATQFGARRLHSI